MRSIYDPPMLRSLPENLYRNLVRKPCLKLLRRRGSYPTFWTMPDDIICREILLSGFYEKELLLGMATIVKNKMATAIDVGANIGNHTLFLARLFRHVISFEPVPRNCWLLKANLHLNGVTNVTLIEKGLSDVPDVLFAGQDDSHNTNVGLTTERLGPSGSREQVEVVKGDDELSRTTYPTPIAMIKIDVEGMEPKVIQGLADTIRRYRPFIFWEASSKEGAFTTASILKEMGYVYFYHLTTNRFSNKYLNKIVAFFGKSTYIVPLTECWAFDGLNAASTIPIPVLG